jgi:glycosyltransferase involved in cell wall biosynthesis
MKLGLLIYGSLDTLSGGYLYDRALVESLRSHGDTVEIISLPWRNYPAHLGDNLRFRLPPGLDLLIQDELNHPSLIAANRRPHPYPVISLVHHLRASEPRPGWQNWFYRIVEARYLASVDGFIFNSNTTRGVVQGLLKDAKPHVVAFPPTDRFGDGLPEDRVQARAKEPGPLRVLFLGNLIPRKGLHTLLEALSLQPSAVRLEVVGSMSMDPSYVQRLQKMVEAGGIGAQVTFHGALEQEDLVALFASSHVLAVPSTYEGFGIVYLEGMSFGLPAIGTTLGAAGELIADGQTGFLVPPDDPGVLASRLASFADDRAGLARMSLNALARYRRQPSWGQTAGEIREFLLRMLRQR